MIARGLYESQYTVRNRCQTRSCILSDSKPNTGLIESKRNTIMVDMYNAQHRVESKGVGPPDLIYTVGHISEVEMQAFVL